MPNHDPHIVQMFSALGDQTRLGVISRLATGPASVGEMAGDARMALPSFMQHLGILEACGLIKSEKVGRIRICRLEPDALSRARDWIEQQRAVWVNKLDSLDDYLAEKMDEEEGTRK
ncbi:helix-turn-helix transcriptional regulator [Rhizobium sp. TH2]|uniref:ArsR/SmtB family transcription factor n=1 Tax=Rhizobium sp. TH2 TaxID=2775403 RepID=UPI00215760CC|nr:metalloregulator ArsR/SmtB family transcription factor [Rhizobium sp. TH2]UVC07398.1 helix-turn-helix transcriptional regulator [Rhizobium sp. TH2]